MTTETTQRPDGLTRHTPGPWEAEQIEETKRGRTTYHWSVWANVRIAVLDGPVRHSEEANARLIAAAPELFETVDTLCNGIEWLIEMHPTIMGEADNEAVAAARALLARIRGE